MITLLSIAGFDACGGAGIQADLKTFSALGCYGLTVLTALPVQNTRGVKAVYSIPEKSVSEQLEAIFEDISVDAVKIGMLHRSEIVEVIADILEQKNLKIVLDPVMRAKNGSALLDKEALRSMRRRLFPLTTLLTPNLDEASQLLRQKINTKKQMEKAALALLCEGPTAVVVKGGHLMESPDDCLCFENKIFWFLSKRILTKNTHGTGCTFSAAISAFLARGEGVLGAVELAKAYLSRCIEAGAHGTLGHGYGPDNHFF